MRILPVPSLSVGILVIAAVIGITIPALVAHALFAHYQEEIRNAEIHAENTARALEQHATRTFETIDAYLQSISWLVGPHLGSVRPEVVHQALRDGKAKSRHVHNIILFDADGTPISEADAYPVRPRQPRIREYIEALRRPANTGLFVGRPTVGEYTRRETIPVARRITKPDGSFGGVVMAALDPAAFQSVYDSLQLGEAATLTLWHADGVLLVRAPYIKDLVDQSFAASDNYRNVIAKGQSAPFWAKGSTDGVERVIAYRHLDLYPLYVSAALSKDTILEHWRTPAWIQASIAGVLTAILVIALGLFAREVRHRQRAVEQITDSEERYRMLAENTTDMVVRNSLDGVRRYVSPASRTLLGYEPHELIGRHPSDLIHPDDREAFTTKIAAVFAGEVERDSATYRLRHREGRWIWVEVNFQATHGADGQPTGLISVVRDVTERRAQAEELRSAKEVAELHLARAEHASQVKANFLAAMSHEIRTPLNSIIGFTDLMLARPQTPETQRQLALVRASGAALLTVVNDILDYSKIEAGKIQLDPKPFSLAGLIDNTVSITQGMVASKDLVISADIDPDVPAWFMGDSDRLRQILLNFLSNAAKFTREGSITVTVRRDAYQGAVLARSGHHRLRFAVTDTGIGIAQDKLAHLFQRFSQVDSSIQRAYGGTGLGLAISKQLVEVMGGTIGVESQEGQGSTFWFSLSLPETAAPEDAPASKPTLVTPRPVTPARILLAEDLEVNQELARAVLEKAGHRVSVVSNGLEAVEAVRDGGPYDLVLMDVQMPILDGIGATKRLRALPGPARQIPIIAMTANVLPDQIARFKQAGMNDHVGKPFRREELLATIMRWLPDVALLEERATPPAVMDVPVVDQATLDALVGLLGPGKVANLLSQLEQRAGTWLQGDMLPADASALAAEAHALISVAGMLGFAELSKSCRELEDACHRGAGVQQVLDAVRASQRRALKEIANRRKYLDAA